MNILVTGGNGFIGTNLCIVLLKQGHKVTSLDLNDSIFTHKNLRTILGDVETFTTTESYDQIYHLACPASPPRYQLNPIKTLTTNFNGTLNMLNIANKSNSRLLFTSTSEIYGDPLISPQTEDYKGNVNTQGPRACYDEGKRVAETLCYDHSRMYGTNTCIARLFNTYGPYMDIDDGRVVSNFINQCIDGEPLIIYGGTQTRSFCYVDDTVDGIIKLMNSNLHETINIGNPTCEITIEEFAYVIKHLMKSNVVVKHGPKQEDDPMQRKPDIAKAIRMLNWKPITSLDDGLIKTINYFGSI